MLQIGKNLTQAGDQLQKIAVQQVFNMIKNPPGDLKTKITQLRIVLSIDPLRYRKLKTTLPYFTCGIFHPPYRKYENFGYIEHFILDFDNLSEIDLSAETLKKKLITDERVEMIFASPSGDGLKVMFRLSEKCFDRVKYSMFYKIFTEKFSAINGISLAADNRTSDVTRACFLSSDSDAYYNPSALTVKQSNYIDFESSENVIEANVYLKESRKKPETVNSDIAGSNELDPDILSKIKLKLNPNTKLKREKIIYVPGELEGIIDKVKARMAEFGISIKSVENIHYGKKFVFVLNEIWAEVNVFYGKKGFSVVKTPKRGSNEELTDISYRILCELFIC